jgi:hypothetical protein
MKRQKQAHFTPHTHTTPEQVDFSRLKEAWGREIVMRKDAAWFGVAPGTLANADSQGTGPRDRFKIGRDVGYWADSFVEWLESRSQKVGGIR